MRASLELAKSGLNLKGDRNNIQGARLKGDYSNVIEKLKKKLKDTDVPLSGNIMMLDSFDGARHVETKKKTVSLISFSSQLCGQSTIEKKFNQLKLQHSYLATNKM